MVKKINKVICFDLDGVICNTNKNYYTKSKPNYLAIKKINKLFDDGNYIKIFTARFMGRNKDNQIAAIKSGYQLTKRQLKKWNLKYHKLILGKPSYDIIIDDKSIFYNKNWIKKIDYYL